MRPCVLRINSRGFVSFCRKTLDTDKLLTLDDNMLFTLLRESVDLYARKTEDRIRRGRLFETVASTRLYDYQDTAEQNVINISTITPHRVDQISDRISLKLSEEFGLGEYEVICDIIRSKTPAHIPMYNSKHYDHVGNLKERSRIINMLKVDTTVRIYMESRSTIKK